MAPHYRLGSQQSQICAGFLFAAILREAGGGQLINQISLNPILQNAATISRLNLRTSVKVFPRRLKHFSTFFLERRCKLI